MGAHQVAICPATPGGPPFFPVVVGSNGVQARFSAPAPRRRLAHGGHRGGVIGLAHLVGHVFGVGDAVGAVDDEDGALQQPPLFEQHAVVAAEIFALVGREGRVGDPFGGLQRAWA